MLGHVVSAQLSERFDVHATARDPSALDLPVAVHAFEARASDDGLEELLAAVRPDAVVNCVGLIKQLPIASDPRAAIAINSLLPHRVAGAATRCGARLVHVSTDCVFSGRLPIPGRYREVDVADAEDLYGKSKLLGEVTSDPHLTLRTSIIGPELSRATGLFEWFRTQPGREVNGFTRAIFSGLTTAALARVIGDVLESQPDLSGVYQVAAEPISKFDLLRRLNDALGSGHEIRPVDRPEINRALDGSRFEAATGIQVPTWDAMIGEYDRELAT
jgi:dTDP-4-dehydrorhamnose reductase